MRSYDERLDFKGLLFEDPDVMKVLSRDELDRVFDLDHQLRHVGAIVDRILSAVPEAGTERYLDHSPGG
jgi:adenylosuccinate lyase